MVFHLGCHFSVVTQCVFSPFTLCVCVCVCSFNNALDKLNIFQTITHPHVAQCKMLYRIAQMYRHKNMQFNFINHIFSSFCYRNMVSRYSNNNNARIEWWNRIRYESRKEHEKKAFVHRKEI